MCAYHFKNVDLSNPTLCEVLQHHRRECLDADKSQTYRITIRRSEVWKDALRNFKRPFDTSQHLRITFLGEPAVDDGGPRREFFMLFMSSLNWQESLLEGPRDRRIMRHNTKALDDDVYRTIGKIVALSIIHGGPGPVFLAESVVNYLFDGKQVKVQIGDIPDVSIQDKLKKVS